ncbi:hypothetical protein IJJ08_03985 [bacterium]|nr:hypothetical protein [bacterium]
MINFNEPLLPSVRSFVASRSDDNLIPLSRAQGKFLFDDLAAITEPIVEKTCYWNFVEMVQPKDAVTMEKEYLAAFAKAGFKPGLIRHPNFEYRLEVPGIETDDAREQITKALEQIAHLERGLASSSSLDDRVKSLGCQLARDKMLNDLNMAKLIDGITHQDDQATKTAIVNIYGKLEPAYIELAQRLYQANQAKITVDTPECEYTSQDIAVFEQKLATAEDLYNIYRYGLDHYGACADVGGFGYNIVLDPGAINIDVRDTSRLGHPAVFVPAQVSYTLKKFLSVSEHELAHARQSLTLSRVFGFGGLKYKCSKEVNYESEGKWADYLFGLSIGQSVGLPHPYYVLGLEKALQGYGFDDLFAYIFTLKQALKDNPSTNASEAYSITRRLLRGCHQLTDNPVGFGNLKDMAYLVGFSEKWQLVNLGLGAYEFLSNVSPRGLQALEPLTIDEGYVEPFPKFKLARDFWESEYKYTIKRRLLKAEEAAILASAHTAPTSSTPSLHTPADDGAMVCKPTGAVSAKSPARAAAPKKKIPWWQRIL